jgi:hypothetical protein
MIINFNMQQEVNEAGVLDALVIKAENLWRNFSLN